MDLQELRNKRIQVEKEITTKQQQFQVLKSTLVAKQIERDKLFMEKENLQKEMERIKG